MIKKHTNTASTFATITAIIENYSEPGKTDPAAVAESIYIFAINTDRLYREMQNTRRKARNVAIEWTKAVIDFEMAFNGNPALYCTNAQLIRYSAEHDGILDITLNYIAEYIEAERAELAHN